MIKSWILLDSYVFCFWNYLFCLNLVSLSYSDNNLSIKSLCTQYKETEQRWQDFFKFFIYVFIYLCNFLHYYLSRLLPSCSSSPSLPTLSSLVSKAVFFLANSRSPIGQSQVELSSYSKLSLCRSLVVGSLFFSHFIAASKICHPTNKMCVTRLFSLLLWLSCFLFLSLSPPKFLLFVSRVLAF